MKDLHQILTILLKYTQENQVFNVSAEHDEIFLRGPKPGDLSEEDAKRLDELICTYDQDINSWHIFV